MPVLKFVSYFRVSRATQGMHGLGMDAQRRAVSAYLSGCGEAWTVLAEFSEVESGKSLERPELLKAVVLAKEAGAKLLIAKLDRLARDVHFTSGLARAGVDFVCADMPEANTFTINIMASVAQQEREMIVARTRAALDSVRERIKRDGSYLTKSGRRITSLGGSRHFDDEHRAKAVAKRKALAISHAEKVLPAIKLARKSGMTLAQTADYLNSLGLRAPRGGMWTPIAVSRSEKRASYEVVSECA